MIFLTDFHKLEDILEKETEISDAKLAVNDLLTESYWDEDEDILLARHCVKDLETILGKIRDLKRKEKKMIGEKIAAEAKADLLEDN